MNRIRKFGKGYQVLHTPNLGVAPSMELITASWDDDHLRGFFVEEFSTLGEAQCVAFRQPDLDWYELVRLHADSYHYLNNFIKGVLQDFQFMVELKPNFMDPETLKETTFNRVLNLGERYSMTYDMNDIVSFCIVNPWTKNLHEIARVLQDAPELRIKDVKVYGGKVIHLIGTTDLGSCYEIKLWPTILHQWAEWQYKHYGSHGQKTLSGQLGGIPSGTPNVTSKLQEIYYKYWKQQDDLDKGMIVR